MLGLKNLFLDCFGGVHLAMMVLLLWALLSARFRQTFESRIIRSACARDLAFIRIVTCAILIVYILFDEDLPSLARFPADWYAPLGYMNLLGAGFSAYFLQSELRLVLLQAALVGLLAAGLAGLFTRLSLPLAAVLYLLAAALLRSWGKNFHTGYISLYVLVVLCFLPCARAWSVDAWLSRRRRTADGESDGPAPRYAWGVYACWAAASIPYLQLGFSKLIEGGPFWWDGRRLLNYALADNLNLTRFDFDGALALYQAPVLLFTLAALFGLVTELLYPLTLLAPPLRRALPACVALLHVGILTLQDVLFLDAILMPLIFLRPGRWLTGRNSGAADDRPARVGGPARFSAAVVPIGLILGMLFISYTSYRRSIPWRWPVTTFRMYAPAGRTDSIVKFRRFLVHLDDGRTIPSNFSEAIGFLAGDYRIDKGLPHGTVPFLDHVLRTLGPAYAPARVVGLTYERRRWDYARQSLADALAAAPLSAVGLVRVPQRPDPPDHADAAANGVGLKNGEFGAWPPDAGLPSEWKSNKGPIACGLADSPDQTSCVLLPWAGKDNTLFQVLTAGPDWYGRAIELEAWVCSQSAGGVVELQVQQPDGRYRTARSGVYEGGGQWRRLSVRAQIAAGHERPPEIRAVLKAGGSERAVAFDDVTVVLLGGDVAER